MTEPVAVATDVRVVYRGRAALDGVSLEVHGGEVLGLIGPNGGGKSTLLLTLAGLVRPTSGEVRVRGMPAHRVAMEGRGTVGLITATPGLYPLLSGWENLAFFGALYGLSEREVRRRTLPFVEELGLVEHLDAPVAAGSSGMQQKVSIARALLMDPPLLLLDEPTSNLDPVSAESIHRVARRHADAGKAVVWVTHDLHAAEQVCDRVALIRRKVLHVERFEGPRAVPARSRLLDLWLDKIEERAA